MPKNTILVLLEKNLQSHGQFRLKQYLKTVLRAVITLQSTLNKSEMTAKEIPSLPSFISSGQCTYN